MSEKIMLRNHTAFIGIGSNLGDRQMFIAFAIRQLSRLEHSRLKSLSKLYATQPVGIQNAVPFLNMVVELKTAFSADELMSQLLQIERDAGRKRRGKNKSRVLDLDILFFDDEVINHKSLNIPHPKFHKRRFMIEPMMDLHPDYIHPVLKKKISEIYKKLDDRHWVIKL